MINCSKARFSSLNTLASERIEVNQLFGSPDFGLTGILKLLRRLCQMCVVVSRGSRAGRLVQRKGIADPAWNRYRHLHAPGLDLHSEGLHEKPRKTGVERGLRFAAESLQPVSWRREQHPAPNRIRNARNCAQWLVTSPLRCHRLVFQLSPPTRVSINFCGKMRKDGVEPQSASVRRIKRIAPWRFRHQRQDRLAAEPSMHSVVQSKQ